MVRDVVLLGWVTAVGFLVGLAYADDAPVVQIREGRLDPPVLAVHVGEVVRWRSPEGDSIRIALDRHPTTAHETAERAGEIYAVFRTPGEHRYVVTIVPTGQQLRGVVAVGAPRDAPQRPLDCAAGSSDRICFMP